MAFQCAVVTPEQQSFDGQITQAIVPAHDGLVGLLTNRAPLLVQLGVGPLRLDLPDGSKRFFLVDGGVAQMRENRLTVLCTSAQPAEAIDYEAAKAKFLEASSAPAATPEEAARRQHRMDVARAMQQMAARK